MRVTVQIQLDGKLLVPSRRQADGSCDHCILQSEYAPMVCNQCERDGGAGYVLYEKPAGVRTNKPRDTSLTKRQLQVLTFIKQSIAERGYAPSVREICDALDITSTNGAKDHLRLIEAKGYIRCDAKVARGIQVLEEPK